MPTYRYRARAEDGAEAPGFLTAGSLPALAAELKAKGLRLEWAEEFEDVRRGRLWLGRVGAFELAGFFRQLGAMINTGAPVVDGLKVLAAETRHRRFARVIDAVRRDVAEGRALSEALARHPRLFSQVAVNLARAGEEGGALGDALVSYAEHLEEYGGLAHEIAAALTYPAIIAIMAAGAVACLLTFMFPRLLSLFDELGISELPAPTRAIRFISEHQWPALILILLPLVGLALIYTLYARTRGGHVEIDSVKLRLPLLGDLQRAAVLARISSTLSVLVRNRVPMLTALDLAGATAANAPIGQALRAARRGVREGNSISRSLEDTQAFPPSFIWQTSVGETSGELAEALADLAKHYRRMMKQMLKHFSGMLEPLVIIIIGVFVGAIVIGMFMPLLGIMASLSGL